MMGMNLHVIHSDLFKGAGLMMGSSYYTPEFSTDEATYYSNDSEIELNKSKFAAEENEANELIATLTNLDG
jgi:hypothetical protein